MFGWRARIGYVNPGPLLCSQDMNRILPEGVVWVYATLDIRSLVREEFERVFSMWASGAEVVASRDVDFIILSGTAVHYHIGYEKSKELGRRIEKSTGIPTMLNATAHINALRAFSAKKIILVSPFEVERNEEEKKFLEKIGFDVINTKGAGCHYNNEISKLPPYTSYRLAKEAFREVPGADAILIECPGWEVLSNIDALEKDIGKPVVSAVAADLWAPLTVLNIKEPIRGYGKLLEML